MSTKIPTPEAVAHLYAHLHVGNVLDHVYVPLSVLLASLGAAGCYAIAAALQQAAARNEDDRLSLRPALLGSLLQRPQWLLGNVAAIAGYALQFLALRHGALALVEPLLVVSLVIALPLSAFLEHRPLTRREGGLALLIIAALALFLSAARPGPGDPHADAFAWIVLGCVTIAVVTACVRGAGPAGPRRAVLLGAGAGILFGVTGAVTETTGHLLNEGIVHVLTSPAPYALLLAGAGGLLLNQSAFQAGELRWSLPVITILEPLVAIAIGEFMFGEHIATSWEARIGEVLGLTAMTLGVIALTRLRGEAASPDARVDGWTGVSAP